MKDKKKIVIILITAVLILTAGIVCRQSPFLMLPLFISLFVMAFQSEANRYAILAGSVNSLIYAAAYVYLGIYASAASAALFSFPLQLATFINWNRRPYKHSVMFKKMKNRTRFILLAGFIALWAGMAAVCMKLDYRYAIMDNGMFLINLAFSVLTLLAYVEYSYIWIFSGVINIMLNIQLVANDYRQSTYLIYSFYSLYCIVLGFINVRKLYKQQQEELKCQ